MDEQETAVAAPSAAPQALELPRAGTPEYAEWRMSGEIPDKPQPKPAAPAPADTGKDPAADPGDTATPKQQERTQRKRKPDAEARIRELTEENRRLKEGREAAKPAAEQPRPVPQPQQHTRPKPTVDGNGPDGNPYTSYEDFVEDLTDWKAEQRAVVQERERARQATERALQAKVEEARGRYQNFDEVLQPTVDAILSDPAVSPAVKAMLNDSEDLPDVIFTLGSDKKELAAFIQMAKTQPGKALRYIAHVENLIEEELSTTDVSGGTAAARDADGKFVKPASEAPAKRGPESAPAPPLEIGNRGAGPMDESARALSAIGSGNPRAFRDWKRAEDQKELRRRRGA